MYGGEVTAADRRRPEWGPRRLPSGCEQVTGASQRAPEPTMNSPRRIPRSDLRTAYCGLGRMGMVASSRGANFLRPLLQRGRRVVAHRFTYRDAAICPKLEA
jgi:hypothetical protein